MQVKTTARGGLRIRQGPGFHWDVVDLFKFGSILTVTGERADADGYSWLHVTAPIRGWVAESFTEVLDDELPPFKMEAWPTNHFRITQRYGNKNPKLYPASIKYRHEGTDIMAPMGSPIFSPIHGIVIRTGYHQAYGYHVRIRNGKYIIVLAHLSRGVDVSPGQRVRPGMPVGSSGNTGNSTGAHLHLSMRSDDAFAPDGPDYEGMPFHIINSDNFVLPLFDELTRYGSDE